MPPALVKTPDDRTSHDVATTSNTFSDVHLSLDGSSASREKLEEVGDRDDFLEDIRRPARPTLAPATSTAARRPSFIDEEEDPIATFPGLTSSPDELKKEAPVTWMSLPKKGQLAVLTIARLVEPLTERSLAAYLFYQLRYFNPDLPDSAIASQGGMFTAAFAAAQFLTAVWWGRAADTPWIGRKRVLLVGLFGTCVSCIGVGFARSFAQALFFRACAGCLNGNVGVMRTMISEIIKEKK